MAAVAFMHVVLKDGILCYLITGTCQCKQKVPAMSSCPLRLHSPAPSGDVSATASQLLKWLLALAAPDEAPSPASIIDATNISFVPSTHTHFQEGLESCYRMLNSPLVAGCWLLRLYTAIKKEALVCVGPTRIASTTVQAS